MAERATIYLLDISTTLALVDSAHELHGPVFDWFQKVGIKGWATCPLVENGFVRIICQPSYPNVTFAVSAAIERLRLLVENAGVHHRWSDDLHLFDSAVFEPAQLSSHRRITDAYLLALAVKHDGCFVTLDTRINTNGVIGAKPTSILTITK